MLKRMTTPALGTALATSLILTACGSDADAPDPLEPQDDTPIEDAPEPDAGTQDASDTDSGAGGDHVAASSLSIDGEEFEIIGVDCRPPDRADWWHIQGEMEVEGDARYMVNVTGNPAPDADENDFFMEIAIPRVPDDNNRSDRDPYFSAPEAFSESADFEFSMEQTSGSIVIAPQFRSIPGQDTEPLPDRDVTFTLVCP